MTAETDGSRLGRRWDLFRGSLKATGIWFGRLLLAIVLLPFFGLRWIWRRLTG